MDVQVAMKGLHAEVNHWKETVAKLQGEEAAGSRAAEAAAQVAKYQDKLSALSNLVNFPGASPTWGPTLAKFMQVQAAYQHDVARLEAGLPAAQEAAQRLPDLRLRLEEAEQRLKTIEGLSASIAMPL